MDDLLHDGGVVVFRGHMLNAGSANEQVLTIRCVATRRIMRAPTPGETWEVSGFWQAHPVHGVQIALREATLVRPSGRLFVQAVSANTKDFPGIGLARAQQLWDVYGPGVFDILDAGDALPFHPLLGETLALVLVSGWKAISHEASAYRWLTHYGFPAELAAKVIAVYGGVPVPAEHAAAASRVGPVVWQLEDDPYRMLAFASWTRTDAVARRLGVAPHDDRRLVGAVEAICMKRLADGHTWVSPAELRRASARLLDLPISNADHGIAAAVIRGALIAHAGGYQVPGAYIMERFVDARCRDMSAGRYAAEQHGTQVDLPRHQADALLDDFEQREGYSLNSEQRAAVWMATTEPIALLLGGPGVGKTTVLKAVHSVAAAQQRTVHQAALAGRAAQRMAEATERPAMTIAALLHRLDAGHLNLNDEPIVVIDEASMCDLPTLYRLLRRFPPGVRLLLVGDPGQLAPIGFGLTFHVLAADTADGAVPRTTLTRVMRQTDESGIPSVCRAISEGVVPDLASPDWSHLSGVSFLEADSRSLTETVIDVLSRLGGARSAQVVGSVKQHDGGVTEINRSLHALYALGRRQLPGAFYPGDPVITTVKNSAVGLLNGELGEVVEEGENGGLRCRFDSGEKVIPAALLSDLDLAYAITTHKAQGSQFARVIVPVKESRLLDRTLLLTAVSRAQQQVILVGDRRVFARAVMAPPMPSRRLVGIGRTAATSALSTLEHE